MVSLFKMLIMMHCIFNFVKNQHFQSPPKNVFEKSSQKSLLFWEGVTKKYAVHSFDNVDNYG